MSQPLADEDFFAKEFKSKKYHHIVVDLVKEALVSGRLKAGDAVPSENSLSASLGISKVSIREAMKVLEALGVVEIKQGHGTFIRTEIDSTSLNPLLFQLILGRRSTKEMHEFRQMYESGYMFIAMDKATPEDIQKLEDILARFKRKIDTNEQTAEDDIEFHRELLRITRNPFIVNVGETINLLLKPSFERVLKRHPYEAYNSHRRILDAIKAKDTQALRQSLGNSLVEWEEFLQD